MRVCAAHKQRARDDDGCPYCQKRVSENVNQEIWAMRMSGASYRKTAAEYNVSATHVVRVMEDPERYGVRTDG